MLSHNLAYKRSCIIKEAVSTLIGPTEIAPEVMLLIKGLQNEQMRVKKEFLLCKLQFKSLEGLRLDAIQDELAK